jgi:dienelactone hydrolase
LCPLSSSGNDCASCSVTAPVYALFYTISAEAGVQSPVDSDIPVPELAQPDVTAVAGPPLTGFRQFSFAAQGFGHCVYYAGDRSHPAVLVMQEIAGLSPGLIYFAERLIAAGFQVYLPWLFGPFQARAPLRNVLRLCISREFAYLRAGRSAPVTRWLRALAAHISVHNGNAPIGAIGMCLTGGFAIPLIIDPQVQAAVAAQPSVPCSLLFAASGVRASNKLGALNVSALEIGQARERLASGAAQMLAVRCRADRICPADKLERLRQEFPVGLEVHEYGAPETRNTLDARPHATYTKEYRVAPPEPADHYARQAFVDLVQFLDRNLRGRRANP